MNKNVAQIKEIIENLRTVNEEYAAIVKKYSVRDLGIEWKIKDLHVQLKKLFKGGDKNN